MVQFKKYYSSVEPPGLKRATSIQKCLRATDLDEVGFTRRHHTFFEMMGNFSFGDYFKKGAIEYGWDFLVHVIGLPPDELWVSVYEEDTEAREIWEKHIGVPAERVVSLGTTDNFWGPAGKTGACGPCSEIYMDLGPAVGCGKPDCAPGCDCDRYTEIWNLVFPQFDQKEDGTRGQLPHPGVDTGMGFERLAMVVQGVDTTYDSDLIRPVFDAVRAKASVELSGDSEHIVSLRIISDHARALTFAIAEGILPSNETRGYLIRRLLRRAAIRGRSLGIEGSFLHELPKVVVSIFGDAYPELAEAEQMTRDVIKSEEERFFRTVDAGTDRLDEMIEEKKRLKEHEITGKDAFYLYDTLGLPFEYIQQRAWAADITCDAAPFEVELERQRERARQASAYLRESFSGEGGDSTGWTDQSDGDHSTFLGYEKLVVDPVYIRKWREVGDGVFELVLSETPFYAEAGGQVTDTGTLSTDGFLFEVDSVYHEAEFIVHRGKLRDGMPGSSGLEARVDAERRLATARNHTATHLLHRALRSVLGKHVQQTGSLVSPERLRFDFSHFRAVDEDELRRIEREINARILEDLPVTTRVTTLSEARGEGVLALFGEKYGHHVRVVEVHGYSKELCGGTHLTRTGEMGQLLLISESAVGAGIRRVEATTGTFALAHARDSIQKLEHAAKVLNVSSDEFEQRLETLVREKETLSHELERMGDERLAGAVPQALESAEQIGSYRFAVVRVDGHAVDKLRTLADRLRDGLKSGIGLVVSRSADKVTFVGVVTDDIVSSQRVKASDVVGIAAKAVGGKGGGKAHLAVAGGRQVENVESAISHVRELVLERLTE
jgi:alanyl-tRNA synthetase